MRVLCVVPARIASSRLPQKPLRILRGEPLIRWVAHRVSGFQLFDRVVVATDDIRVADAVAGLDVDAVLTDPAARCGTERVAEVAARPEYDWADIVVNVQGDEPFVPREAVDGVVEMMVGGQHLATVAGSLDARDLGNRNVVKVFVTPDGVAQAFVRRMPSASDGEVGRWYRHIGVYGYTPSALARWAATPVAEAEREERLEQLRPHSRGERFGVRVISVESPSGIDTVEDLEAAARRMADAVRLRTLEQVGACQRSSSS